MDYDIYTIQVLYGFSLHKLAQAFSSFITYQTLLKTNKSSHVISQLFELFQKILNSVKLLS